MSQFDWSITQKKEKKNYGGSPKYKVLTSSKMVQKHEIVK
jgi:hypothetical protein